MSYFSNNDENVYESYVNITSYNGESEVETMPDKDVEIYHGERERE